MSELRGKIVEVLREFDEVRNIRSIADALETIIRAHILDKLEDEIVSNHGKLGIMLADKDSSEAENNWQGGRVNGLYTAKAIVQDA